MFSDVAGGGQPASSWIAWHAILMTGAFPCLMSLGRWVYHAEGEYLESVLEGKTVRRRAHRAIMSSAVLSLLVGYFGIFMSHWPVKKFFGYDFVNDEWAALARIVHVYLGYAVIMCALAQAVMGAFKMDLLLREDKRVFTFHGTLGKAIILAGCANVIVACYFWGWDLWLKALIATLAAGSGLLGAFWQKTSTQGEATVLLDKTAV